MADGGAVATAGSSSDTSSQGPSRQKIPSLCVLAQIEVIKIVQAHASRLETEYIQCWAGKQLTDCNRKLEESLNIRHPEVDTEAIVLKYSSVEADLARQKREEMEKRLGSSIAAARRRSRKGRKGGSRRQVSGLGDERLLQSLRPRIVRGIPEGVAERDYIEYRKCKYIEDIKKIRNALIGNLSADVLNSLMSTMFNISQFNCHGEHGFLTLQAMLMTPKTRDFRCAPHNFYMNFATQGPYHVKELQPNMETRIGTTILHYTLLDGSALTHLSLEKCCCDSLLKVVADVAHNLRYLNISNSVVSDVGLLYLCGCEKDSGRRRPKLARVCKIKSPKQERLVLNEVPKWEKKRIGCANLVHFQGENLQRLDWPGQAVMKYYDHSTVPMDAGFVAMLTYMPGLTSFVTDVGGRVIQAWQKLHAKRKKTLPTLKLEMLSESHLTPPLLELISETCPNLTRLRVDWYEFFTPQLHHSREDWIESLPSCKKLSYLEVADIDFKSNKLVQVMPTIGVNMTVVKLSELWQFKYSNFRAIKTTCPNLTVFSVHMTTKNVVTAINHIVVDKDFNLQLSRDPPGFHKLTEFHLSGPFGNELVRYLLRGADGLKSLTLGIEWLDPAFCDSQPLNRKDLIGPEYLTELLAVNKLSDLEEIHLLAQYRRGRSRLVKATLDLILEKFPKIRHIGNFNFWNISKVEQRIFFAQVRSTNRNILFDEDLYGATVEPGREVFQCKYIEERSSLACCRNHIVLKKDTSNFLSDFFDVLAGPPNLMDDDLSEDDDDLGGADSDDESHMSIDLDEMAEADEEAAEDDDFLDAVDEDEDIFGDELEPACSIM